MALDIKTIGSSGQISLGKQYAGRTVIVDEIEEGVWVVKASQVIPDNELWLHQSPAREKLAEAIKWAEENPPRTSNLDLLGAKLKRSR